MRIVGGRHETIIVSSIMPYPQSRFRENVNNIFYPMNWWTEISYRFIGVWEIIKNYNYPPQLFLQKPEINRYWLKMDEPLRCVAAAVQIRVSPSSHAPAHRNRFSKTHLINKISENWNISPVLLFSISSNPDYTVRVLVRVCLSLSLAVFIFGYN